MNNDNSNQLLETIGHVASLPKSLINALLSLVLAGGRRRILGEFRSIARKVDSLRDSMVKLSDEELRNKTITFRARIDDGESLDNLLVEAFAVAREAARRVLQEEPYLVQIMGGIALHNGMIAEMKTGEGKTLVAILPAYLNALSGLGVHIVTVNDYLAKRDAEWMGRVFEFLGLTVGYVISSMPQSSKYEAYAADVTYCTNNELGFDFLRDNMVESEEEACQRGLNYCIVDEADSVLIDEARTPLIISGPTSDTSDGYIIANTVVIKLQPEHYEINLKEHQAHFTDAGIEEITRILRESDLLGEDEYLYSAKNSVLLHQLSQALKANHLYRLGVDYIIDIESDGFGGRSRPAIKIIDEHTGRTLHGRRYSDGLHQALEAKEHVVIRPESETLASITFQRLFRLYDKLSGMTGTALTESEEFEKTYGLKCIDIPTNLPKRRIDHDDMIYLTKREKLKAIVELVAECHARGQPVIVGTTSVESSEELGELLTRAGFNLNVLNAKNHEREADIIANAGRYGAITVVTNIAGRGTDIKLGGDFKVLLKRRTLGSDDEEQIKAEAEKIRLEIAENKARVLEAGGLYVIGVEHNNNRRIDNQLRGRSGRQGDPGASKFFMCTEDELIRKFNPNMGALLKQFGAKEDEVMEHPWLTNAVSTAQKRMEAYNFEVRQSLQKYSDIKESYMLKFYERRRNLLRSNASIELPKLLESLLSKPATIAELKKMLNQSQDDDNIFISHTRTEFYSKLQMYKDQYGENIEDGLRKFTLKALDTSCRRYMTLMSNARDVVAFQAYTQKDPIMSFYNIARDKFNKMIYMMDLEIITNFLQSRAPESFEGGDFLSSLASLRDYLSKTMTEVNEDNEIVGDYVAPPIPNDGTQSSTAMNQEGSESSMAAASQEASGPEPQPEDKPV